MQRTSSYKIEGTTHERYDVPFEIQLRQAYADWFRTFNWSWYVTLTFSRDRKKIDAEILLEQYLRQVEELIRAPLSCLIAPEEKPSGLGKEAGRGHFHLLVGSASSILTESTFKDLWHQPNYGGTWVSKPKTADQHLCPAESAHVVPYDRSIDASFYLFKTMGLTDWDWSVRRLHFVCPTPPASAATSTQMRSVLKRQAARHLSAQIEQPFPNITASESTFHVNATPPSLTVYANL